MLCLEMVCSPRKITIVVSALLMKCQIFTGNGSIYLLMVHTVFLHNCESGKETAMFNSPAQKVCIHVHPSLYEGFHDKTRYAPF